MRSPLRGRCRVAFDKLGARLASRSVQWLKPLLANGVGPSNRGEPRRIGDRFDQADRGGHGSARHAPGPHEQIVTFLLGAYLQ